MDTGDEDMFGSDPIGDPENVLVNLTIATNMSSANASFSLRCGVLDENYMKVWNACQWWCEGIFFTGIGLVGLVANFASIGILSTKDMRYLFDQSANAPIRWGHFTNILHAAFVPISLCQKNTNLSRKYKKAVQKTFI